MDRIKRFLFGGRGGRARPIFLLSAVFLLIVGLASYFKTDGIRSVLDSDKKIREKTEDLTKMAARNAELREKINAAQAGSYQTEKYAREKLLMAKENEVVFRFRDAQAGSKGK
ncbi:MAG: septum formation initiator family protein [Nitrospinae bacterium]|nr:septum formation initiator family protein [Nitrospinota bacterium]